MSDNQNDDNELEVDDLLEDNDINDNNNQEEQNISNNEPENQENIENNTPLPSEHINQNDVNGYQDDENDDTNLPLLRDLLIYSKEELEQENAENKVEQQDDNIEKKRILLQEKLNSGKYGKSVETVGWGNRYIWF